MVRDLNDEAFDVEACGDLNDILERYVVQKKETYEAMHTTAINGVIGGAKNYLEKIIKMQTRENSFGQNQTLLKLRDFIAQIYSTRTG